MIYRYRKFIYITKFLILGFIVISLGFIAFISLKQENKTSTDDKEIAKDQVTITDTVFSSSGKKPYRIVAKEVSYSNDGTYVLNTISGSYNLDDKQTIDIKASTGNFNSISNFVELKNDVKISYLGYNLISEGIALDLQHHSAKSPNEIYMFGTSGSISANSFETTEEFNQITFHGDVKANFIINNNKR